MSQRKTDHIVLANHSLPQTLKGDNRFYYEPLLGTHNTIDSNFVFLGKTMKQRLWVSSMTGGAEKAGKINHLLAEACAEFGLGMGLGSCRPLLDTNKNLSDFNLRPILGDSVPFFANLGIAQIEKLASEKALQVIDDKIMGQLNTDGLIIHVNPIQELLQPEGDHQNCSAFETIGQFCEQVNGRYKIVIKEVGQGMGKTSLEKLLNLPIDGIELGAFGGTNFAAIELLRNTEGPYLNLWPLTTIGHTAEEMIEWLNQTIKNFPQGKKRPEIIISGGIQNFLDGYYCIQLSKFSSVYGMANTLLQRALHSKKALFDFIQAEKIGYNFAQSFLTIRGKS